MVDLEYGLPSAFERDLAGQIVLIASDIPDWHDRYIHRREKYYRAVEAGAAAFVYRNHVDGCLPPTGSVGTEAAPIGEIPAVGVSKEVGKTILMTELVVELASSETTVSHRQPSEIAAQLERKNRAEGLRVIGDWPYEAI